MLLLVSAGTDAHSRFCFAKQRNESTQKRAVQVIALFDIDNQSLLRRLPDRSSDLFDKARAVFSSAVAGHTDND